MADDGSLSGKVAVVTGASSGIGEAVARRLGAEGMDLVVAARRMDELERVAGEIADAHGVRAVPAATDVRSWESVRGLSQVVEETMGGVDVAVVSAGTGTRGTVVETEVAAWNRVLETNLTGTFHTAKALLPLMEDRADPSTFAVVAGLFGTRGVAGLSAYCASKWGIRGFVQSLALEAAPRGIRCTTINPGYVATDMVKDMPRREAMLRPGDVADVVVRLATLPGTALVDDLNLWPVRMYTD